MVQVQCNPSQGHVRGLLFIAAPWKLFRTLASQTLDERCTMTHCIKFQITTAKCNMTWYRSEFCTNSALAL
jgi:hypothetical protein